LIDSEALSKFDQNEMHLAYNRWPEISKNVVESGIIPIDYTDINNIIFVGMGGSGAIGDIFASILSKTNIHVTVVKGYLLPKTSDKNSLIVTTSVSGNTRETLSALKKAKEIGCKVIAFSSGGKMEEYCLKNKIEYRKIEQIHSPRASFTIYLYSIIKILNSIIPISKEDVKESIEQLENTKKNISSNNLNSNNISLNLAEWIEGIPVIYYPFGLQSSAIRFKNSLQENSKNHAMVEDIVESCHNGIVSWEKSSLVQPILIQGNDDFIKTKERWVIVKEYFDDNNIKYKEIFSVKGSILSKIINLIYVLDYTSIYLAVKNKVDPSPVKSIDFIKTKL
jgi:glucose/mannose-6-phosphate isomerase